MGCIISLFILVVGMTTVKAQENTDLSRSREVQFQAPFCYKSQNKDEIATRKYTNVIRLYKATFKNPLDPKSVWDQDFLKNNPHVLEVIRDFKKGRKGASIKKINLEGKTAEILHKNLMKQGFSWSKTPLQASLKKQSYWLSNGKTTQDKEDSKIVYIHTYTHPDGGIVRIKAAGIPDVNGKHPRRAAHASKAVLLNTEARQCKGKICDYDTSYQNEAFKVTNENQPIPKAPSPKFGLKIPKKNKTSLEKRKVRLVKNVVMNMAHTNLENECPLPTQ